MKNYARLPIVTQRASVIGIPYIRYNIEACLHVAASKREKQPFLGFIDEHTALKCFIENIKNRKLDEARLALCNMLKKDGTIDLLNLAEFIRQDSQYKCLPLGGDACPGAGVKKQSVLIMTEDMPKTLMHVYMKQEHGRWRIYGIERE